MNENNGLGRTGRELARLSKGLNRATEALDRATNSFEIHKALILKQAYEEAIIEIANDDDRF